jgi:DHA2 family multidrug resistance protein
MMLDRGEQKDWFSSLEIVTEAVLFGLGLYLFIVHMIFAEKPFIQPRIFKDINYLAGFLVMFAIGMVLLASSALLAPYLQTLGNYPVQTVGILMAPRGIGTMVAMMVAGRLTNRVDPRLMMGAGFLGIALSVYFMTDWTPDVGPSSLAGTTFLQGFGLGLVFTPLQVVAFATLPGELRADGTALISLIRNVGSAIGISVASFMLAQNTQIVHATLAEHVTPFNRMLQTGGAYLFWNSATSAGLAALNSEITRQALIVAYLDDFKLMLLVSLPSVFLLFLMRKPKRVPARDLEHSAVMD